MYNYPIPIRAHAIPYTNYSFTSRHNTYHKFLESLMHVCRVVVFYRFQPILCFTASSSVVGSELRNSAYISKSRDTWGI